MYVICNNVFFKCINVFGAALYPLLLYDQEKGSLLPIPTRGVPFYSLSYFYLILFGKFPNFPPNLLTQDFVKNKKKIRKGDAFSYLGLVGYKFIPKISGQVVGPEREWEKMSFYPNEDS